MRVELIENYQRFEELRDNWDAVYMADPEANYFVSWVFMAQAFTFMERGWRVIAVRPDANSPYVAFLPLRVTAYVSKTWRLFCNQYDAAGTPFWPDFTGLICAASHEDAALPALAAYLTTMPWAEIEFRHLLMSDRRQKLFVQPFKTPAFKVANGAVGKNRDGVDNDVCPYMDLPGTFEDFLQNNLSNITRPKMRRVLRKLEASEDLRVTVADRNTFERDIDIILALWRERWASRKGGTIGNKVKRFKNILMSAAARDLLFLPVLWQGNKPLGALGHFIDRDKKVVLQKLAGRDDTCKNPPPGLLLHGYSIRWAIEQGMTTYEFLRGDEAYKFSYGATASRRLTSLRIRTDSRLNANKQLDPLSIAEVLERAARFKEEGALSSAYSAYRQVLDIAPDHPVAGFLVTRVRRPSPRAKAEAPEE